MPHSPFHLPIQNTVPTSLPLSLNGTEQKGGTSTSAHRAPKDSTLQRQYPPCSPFTILYYAFIHTLGLLLPIPLYLSVPTHTTKEVVIIYAPEQRVHIQTRQRYNKPFGKSEGVTLSPVGAGQDGTGQNRARSTEFGERGYALRDAVK